ncbi:MAG: methyltransferase domain-containing protein [Candidatus Dadabacteria bacterium]|nr:MAG: methyltransferase domain-containing protein [Candidatus Dadabacteria bacterium]
MTAKKINTAVASNYTGESDRKDTIYNVHGAGNTPFRFGQRVARVFDDMAVRSIPLYNEVQRLSAALALKYYIPETHIYDLGCSTGTTIVALQDAFRDQAAGKKNIPPIVGIDCSAAMVSAAKTKVSALKYNRNISVEHKSIENVKFKRSSVVILNYTLQFLPLNKRADILKKIADSVVSGGILILSEKTAEQDALKENLFTELYYDFKLKNGYTLCEIEEKKKALEGVLIPLSEKQNSELAEAAGFTPVLKVLRGLNFVTFVGFKR